MIDSQRNRHAGVAFGCVALLSLSACGGGGGGKGGNPPAPPVNQSPTSAFGVSATSGNAPLTVTVDAGASSDPDGVITTFVWDFGGTPGFGRTAQYTFVDSGSFTVRLTVTDDDGAAASSTSTIDVTTSAATATVGGTIQILSSTAIDADVNDRLTFAQSNNTFDDAQPIPSAVTLGGFANVARAGQPTGKLFADGDPGDFYRISLTGNEIMILDIADASADLDLRLWDESRNLVDASLGITTTESIEARWTGNYFLEVFPFSGASNYVLRIGANSSADVAAMHNGVPRKPARLSDPFLPGEVIVKASQHRVSDIFARANLRRLSRTRGAVLAALRSNTPSMSPRLPPGGHLSAALEQRYQTLMTIKALARRPDVDYAEPNMIVQRHAAPNDTFFDSQWHYPAINLPLAWDVSTGSPDVIVAVIDTGVLLQHPDLRYSLVDGYDFVSNPQRARDNDGIDDDPNDPGDLEYGGSSSFHGTHVAGTIGAQTDNASGVAGVGWQTRIMPVRALGKDGGTTFDVTQAVRWAAGLDNDSGTVPQQPADIINLSLGSTFSSQSEQDTFNQVRARGILVIASAGNESSSLPSYPAAYDGVIGVSATTITNAIASYSNYGSFIDIAAPGGSNLTDLNGDGIGDGVISAMGDDSGPLQFGYAYLSGTSMAAPHVAGVAALMKSVHPALTPAQFETALHAGELTDDLGAPGRDDRYGYGLVNAQKAVFAAEQLANGQGTDPGPILSSSSSTLNFGTFASSLTLRLHNIGTGNVNVTNVTTNRSWLTLQAPGSANGLGDYTLTVDRSAVADGAYQANVTFASDSNTVIVNVIMQVTSLDLIADAGLHYVILVGGDGLAAVPSVVVTADRGEYSFTISGVPYGQYRLFAGTDSDDDSRLCDAGEACGAYPTLDSPIVLSVNGDIGGLEFNSGFRVNLTGNGATTQTTQTGRTHALSIQK